MANISGISNAKAPYNPSSSSATGALGKEDFLKLLVAQLSHQDPTKPTDPSEFVAQLSQFTSLEQLLNIKDGLDVLAITQTAGTSAQMVSFIGKDVAFDGGQVVWSDKSSAVDMRYTLKDPAASLEVRVVDSSGKEIEKIKLAGRRAGEHEYVFNGKKADGTALPPGTYTVELTAIDGAGATSNIALRGRGLVEAVTFDAGYPQLLLADGRTISLAQVLEVLGGSGSGGGAGLDLGDLGHPGVTDPTRTDDATPSSGRGDPTGIDDPIALP